MPSSDPAPPPEFLQAFAARAHGADRLPFFDFVELALYHPQVGYYRRARPRIGYGPETDFITAASSRPYFGSWVAAACTDLLAGRPPAQFRFLEIGAEPEGGILAGRPHPFSGYLPVRIGQAAAPADGTIVFSNELFDAQPFRRFVFRRGGWRELGVALENGTLQEGEIASALPAWLPARAAEDYHIDAPTGAVALLEQLVASGWRGLFVALDYGKSWRELAEATPAGTARAYRRHAQSNDLLAHPGEQDLTCHVCWDWLEAALRRAGFGEPTLESQEAFFVRHASAALEAAADPALPALDPAKRALAQLLHPAHFGQKFQVLHAARW